MKNKLRKALIERRVTLGGWLHVEHPACAEMVETLDTYKQACRRHGAFRYLAVGAFSFMPPPGGVTPSSPRSDVAR